VSRFAARWKASFLSFDSPTRPGNDNSAAPTPTPTPPARRGKSAPPGTHGRGITGRPTEAGQLRVPLSKGFLVPPPLIPLGHPSNPSKALSSCIITKQDNTPLKRTLTRHHTHTYRGSFSSALLLLVQGEGPVLGRARRGRQESSPSTVGRRVVCVPLLPPPSPRPSISTTAPSAPRRFGPLISRRLPHHHRRHELRPPSQGQAARGPHPDARHALCSPSR